MTSTRSVFLAMVLLLSPSLAAALDCNSNGIDDSDARETDCNGNGVPDSCDIVQSAHLVPQPAPAAPGNGDSKIDMNGDDLPDFAGVRFSVVSSTYQVHVAIQQPNGGGFVETNTEPCPAGSRL